MRKANNNDYFGQSSAAIHPTAEAVGFLAGKS